MLISGMNRYFAKHGRIIGLVILPIIIVTFVFYFGRGSLMDMFSGRSGVSNVTILERTVTLADKQKEVTRMYILASLQNPKISLTNARMPLNSQNIVINLLQYYAAEDMGLAIGDKEVSEYLKTVPIFQSAGKFDAKLYDLYVSGKLKPAYLTQNDLKDAVQHMLRIQALRKTISESVIVPEAEIKEAYMNDMQSVEAEILKFDASTYAKDITLTDEDLKNYYESNKQNYNTAPGVKGKVVVFAFEDCKEEAATQVTDAEMRKYYDDNKFQYKLPEKIDPKDSKNKSIKPAHPLYKTFTEVKAEIKEKLISEKVAEIALNRAQEFADKVAILTSDVFYDITDQDKAKIRCIEIFEQNAAKNKLKVEESGWLYSGDKDPKGLAKETALVDMMNGLFFDNPVSEPVKGSRGYMVAILDEKKKSTPQSFSEAKEKIREDLLAARSLTLAREKARSTALKISEMLDKGQKIDEITKELKLKFDKLPQWSSQMLGYFKGSGNLQATALETAFATPVGEVAPVKDTPTGAFIVYVVKKNIPTESEFEKQKAMFAMRYKMTKQNLTYQSFLQSLMNISGITTAK